MPRSASLLAMLALLAPLAAQAGLVTIEPDRFASGSNLSTISPFVTLGTGEGGSVFASDLFPRWGDPRPDDLLRNGPLRRHVFSGAPADNTEWYALPYEYDVDTFNPAFWAEEGSGALIITFHAPVNYVSLLGAEIIGDAGCCTDDPMRAWVYDSSDRLIAAGEPFRPIAFLGTANWDDSGYPGYPVRIGEWSFPDIHRIVIGGHSEPTTFDRLRFRTINVPEPGSLGLLSISLLGVMVARRKVRQSSLR